VGRCTGSGSSPRSGPERPLKHIQSNLPELLDRRLHLSFRIEYEALAGRYLLGQWKGMTNMRNFWFRNTTLRLLLSGGLAALPLTLALGHEGHHVECNETAINALKADIQAMGAGEARTTASKEVEVAQQMMAKNDIEGCKNHIHSAMEATEK